MAINGISMGKMDWTGALNALNDIKGVKAKKNGDSITITRTGEGKPVMLTLSIPQLDDPEVFSTAELEKLVNDFDNLRAGSPFPITETERQAFVNALNSAFDKMLKEDPKTVGGDLGIGPKRGASKSLFDVYAIFKLLITVAQLQRNALRDVRQAENAAVQKAILNSAEEQRSAAIAGLIGGLVVCGIQLCAQGAALREQGKKFLQQMEIKNASGVGAAKTNLNTSKLAGNANAAQKNLNQLGKNLGTDTKGNSIRGEIDKSFESGPEYDKVKKLGNKIHTDYTKAKEGVEAKREALGQLTDESDKLGSLEELRAQETGLTEEKDQYVKELETARNAHAELVKRLENIDKKCRAVKNPLGEKEGKLYEEKRGILADLKASESDLQTKEKDLKAKIEDCDKKLDQVKQTLTKKVELVGDKGDGGTIGKVRKELNDLQEKLNAGYDKLPDEQKKDIDAYKQAQKDYCGEVDAVENKYKQEFEAARTEYREALKSGDKAAIKDAKTNFENTQKKYEYAHAKAIEAKIADGGMTRSDAAGRYGMMDAEEVKIAQNDIMTDDAYQQLEQDRAKLGVYEGMIQSAGMAMQQMVQQISQLMQAKAHALGAREQEARNELDQINDLFANCQKLLEAVLQAMIAVIQAESQSVDTTIQGLRG